MVSEIIILKCHDWITNKENKHIMVTASVETLTMQFYFRMHKIHGTSSYSMVILRDHEGLGFLTQKSHLQTSQIYTSWQHDSIG